MITNIEFENDLNKLAEELFPNLKLDFMVNRLQPTIFITNIQLACSVAVDRSEVLHGGILDKVKLEYILKMRVKDALIKLENLVQNDLDKLEESDG